MGHYESWEERPRHPVTGVQADFYWEFREQDESGEWRTVREPRWSEPFVKNASPERCWYSVEEVAERIGKDAQYVRRMCREGRLVATKPRGSRLWFIRGDEVIAFIEGQSAVAPLPDHVTERGARP